MSLARPRWNLVGRKSRPTGIYCGSQDPPPNNRTAGTKSQCFKKGIAVGRMMGEQTGIETGRQQGRQQVIASQAAAKARRPTETAPVAISDAKIKAARLAGEASATARMKKTGKAREARARVAGETAGVARGQQSVKSRIKQQGLAALRNTLTLDALNKDEVRSIIQRERQQRPAFVADSAGYSNMSKNQLMDLLQPLGWKR